MKNMKLLVTVLFLGGALGLGETSARAEDVISKEVAREGNYCHAKFETIREETLASAQPVLKDVDDIVDFYGPCDHNPLGKEEVQAQKDHGVGHEREQKGHVIGRRHAGGDQEGGRHQGHAETPGRRTARLRRHAGFPKRPRGRSPSTPMTIR